MKVSCSAGPAAVAAANAVSASHGVGSLISGPTNFHELIEEGANLVDKYSYSAATSQSNSQTSASPAQNHASQVDLNNKPSSIQNSVAKVAPKPQANGKPVKQVQQDVAIPQPVKQPQNTDVQPKVPSQPQQQISKQIPNDNIPKGKKITVKRLLDSGQTRVSVSPPRPTPPKKIAVTTSVSKNITPTPVISLSKLTAQKDNKIQTISLNDMSPVLVSTAPAVQPTSGITITGPNPNQLKAVKVTLHDPSVLNNSYTSSPTIIIQSKSGIDSSCSSTPIVSNVLNQTSSQSSGSPGQKGKRRGCRCGLATPNPGKLTCCGQRCPCYVDGKGCFDCKCRGCRNPHRANTNSGIPVTPAVKPTKSSSTNGQTTSTTTSTTSLTTTSPFIPAVTAVNLISLPVSSINQEGNSLFISPNLTLTSNAAAAVNSNHSNNNNSFCFVGSSGSVAPSPSPSETLNPVLDEMLSSDECELTKMSYLN